MSEGRATKPTSLERHPEHFSRIVQALPRLRPNGITLRFLDKKEARVWRMQFYNWKRHLRAKFPETHPLLVAAERTMVQWRDDTLIFLDRNDTEVGQRVAQQLDAQLSGAEVAPSTPERAAAPSLLSEIQAITAKEKKS